MSLLYRQRLWICALVYSSRMRMLAWALHSDNMHACARTHSRTHYYGHIHTHTRAHACNQLVNINSKLYLLFLFIGLVYSFVYIFCLSNKWYNLYYELDLISNIIDAYYLDVLSYVPGAYNELYTLYNVCTMYLVQWTLHIYCTVHNVQCTMYICIMYIHCATYNVTDNRTMYNVQCTKYTVQCTKYTVQCTIYTVHYTMYHVLCYIHYKRCIPSHRLNICYILLLFIFTINS